MKKIVLVEPKPPGYHFYSRLKLPRLGLVLLGTILKEKGYDVRIYIEDIHPIEPEHLLSADVVGISTITSTAMRAYALADTLKQKGIPVVLGGPHPTFLPDEALTHAPYVIRGEGEETIGELVEALETGSHERLDTIEGLSFWDGEKAVHNPDRPLCQELDSLPSPDLNLIVGYWASKCILDRKAIVPLITSRGCPFGCHFCSVSPFFGKSYRFLSPARVIEDLKKFKGKFVFFYDDNFAAHTERTKELLRRMIEEGLTDGWCAQVRPEVARDEELLRLMKASNCFRLYIGLESINPATLEAYQKKLSLKDIKECIRIIRRHGIKVHGMFVLGSDQDDIKVIRKTATFALRLRIDSVQFSILTPLPGSKLFSKFKEENKIFTYNWSLYDAHHVVFRPAKMVPIVLQRETFKALSKFYSWWQVFREFLRGDIYNALIKSYGHRMIRKWKKVNKEFKEKLTGEYYEEINRLLSHIVSFEKQIF